MRWIFLSGILSLCLSLAAPAAEEPDLFPSNEVMRHFRFNHLRPSPDGTRALLRVDVGRGWRQESSMADRYGWQETTPADIHP